MATFRSTALCSVPLHSATRAELDYSVDTESPTIRYSLNIIQYLQCSISLNVFHICIKSKLISFQLCFFFLDQMYSYQTKESMCNNQRYHSSVIRCMSDYLNHLRAIIVST